MSIAGELLAYLWRRKFWWKMPMVTILALSGLLLVFTQGTALGRYIDTLL